MLSIPPPPFLHLLIFQIKNTFTDKSDDHKSRNNAREQANQQDQVPPPKLVRSAIVVSLLAARSAEAKEVHAPVGIVPCLPSSQPTRTRRGRSIPTTRHDRADQGTRERPPTTRTSADQEGTSEAEPAPSGWDLVQALQPNEAQPVPPGQGLSQRGPFRDFRLPSKSHNTITGRVTDSLIRELGLDGGTAFQYLMLDRSLGNREARGRRLETPLDELRARSETRILGRRSESRWDNLSSTFKNFVVWAAETLRAPDLEAINVAWKIIWWVEAKLAAKHIEFPSARKYVKNLVQTCKECGLAVEDEVTTAYKESLLRDGALRAGHQAPPAEKKDIDKTEPLMTPTEYLGTRLTWKTASRVGEMRYLMKHHFENIRGRIWAITFPYHKGDPYRLGTCITVELDEQLHLDLVARLEWVPAGVSVTDLTTRRAEAVLGAVRKGLSAHSIKRGALVTMLRAGVPMTQIQIVAKHKDLDTLMTYLPRAEVAMAMKLHEATACL